MIKGGNKAAFDFFEVYDLMNEPVQKRYNTVAAQFYRESIKGALDSGSMLPSAVNRIPSFDEGRQAIKNEQKQTPQIRPYSQLNRKSSFDHLWLITTVLCRPNDSLRATDLGAHRLLTEVGGR